MSHPEPTRQYGENELPEDVKTEEEQNLDDEARRLQEEHERIYEQ
jgi:hypothetical protein